MVELWGDKDTNRRGWLNIIQQWLIYNYLSFIYILELVHYDCLLTHKNIYYRLNPSNLIFIEFYLLCLASNLFRYRLHYFFVYYFHYKSQIWLYTCGLGSIIDLLLRWMFFEFSHLFLMDLFKLTNLYYCSFFINKSLLIFSLVLVINP